MLGKHSTQSQSQLLAVTSLVLSTCGGGELPVSGEGSEALRSLLNPHIAVAPLPLPSLRDHRVMAGLQRETAAVKVLHSIPAQSNVLSPIA